MDFTLTDPVAPPDSGLGTNYTELLNTTCDYLGYGPLYSAISDVKQTEVERVVTAGVRAFYTPLHPKTNSPYRWSFLYPSTQLTIDSEDEYLPSHFGGLQSPITFSGLQSCDEIRTTSEFTIRKLRATCPRTGAPQYAAIITSQSSGASAWTAQILFWPTPDTSYTLQLNYFVQPPALSDDAPYPLGPPYHADTIIASCLAKAEILRDDVAGPRQSEYKERLLVSIGLDEDLSTPESYGYLDSGSDVYCERSVNVIVDSAQ